MRLRLLFLLIICLFLLAACRAAPTPVPLADPAPATLSPTAPVARYEAVQEIRFVNTGRARPEQQLVWVALLPEDEPGQRILSRSILPAAYDLVIDEYGNHYAEFDLSEMPPGSTRRIELRYELEITRRDIDLGDCLGPLPTIYLQSELHIESNNPRIKALADQLSADQPTPCAKVRAFYDYIGDHLVYSFNGQSWGAQAALGPMGADCSEFSSLLVALSRAAGIPARYVEGLVYLQAAESGLARTEHAWVEVFLPEVGWTPVDPTLGRAATLRERYFGHFPPNHILITRGRNPSTLRGGSYWTHLYWPGSSTTIQVQDQGWQLRLLD